MRALGLAMAVMGFVAPVGVGARVAEVAAPALAAFGGVLLLTRGTRAAMASGGSALLASLIYLAVTNTEFHEGGVEYSIAVMQFVTVPIGLVLGGTAFALPTEAAGGALEVRHRRRARRLADERPPSSSKHDR